jgi:hypothetical protein
MARSIRFLRRGSSLIRTVIRETHDLRGAEKDARENYQAPAHRGRRRDLANDDGLSFSTVAKLVDVLQRALPQSPDLELKEDALHLGSELLRGTKYEEER